MKVNVILAAVFIIIMSEQPKQLKKNQKKFRLVHIFVRGLKIIVSYMYFIYFKS